MLRKRLFFTLSGIVFLSIALVSCSKTGTKPVASVVTPTPPVTPTTPPAAPVYALIWSDEFDGTAVDTTKWTFEKGNLNVNGEQEYYQPQNATVSNGNLVITAKKEAVGGQPYTSARMNTLGKFSQLYGRIEARIKLPLGRGMWPAFWMMGTNIATVSWPQCGELDIMEHVNDDDLIYGTMHWNVNGHVQYGSATRTTAGDYHLYAIEWDKRSIRWYVDSTLYQTGDITNSVNNTGAFHLPFFILLNLAVGGDFPAHGVDESLLPETMYVDYVRVYKQTN